MEQKQVFHTAEQKQQIQDMQRMVSELKKHLKQQSKNNLIAMVTNNLIEIHNLKIQLNSFNQAVGGQQTAPEAQKEVV